MELHRQWELLLEKMREKGVKLLQAQKLVQYLRECEDVMDWINDKVRVPGAGLQSVSCVSGAVVSKCRSVTLALSWSPNRKRL